LGGVEVSEYRSDDLFGLGFEGYALLVDPLRVVPVELRVTRRVAVLGKLSRVHLVEDRRGLLQWQSEGARIGLGLGAVLLRLEPLVDASDVPAVEICPVVELLEVVLQLDRKSVV